MRARVLHASKTIELQQQDCITSAVHVPTLNPLDVIGICLNKQLFMYKVLAPSIITPI